MTQAVRILIASAGRRNYLVDFFRQAIGSHGSILAADVSPSAPALYAADRWFLLPRVDAPDYLPELLGICEREDVDLVVSVNDLELPILARSAPAFQAVGTRVLVSSSEVVTMCHDKLRMAAHLESHGIPCPRSASSLDEALTLVDAGELAFPLVVKPRWGSGSVGLAIVEDVEELRAAVLLARRRLGSIRHFTDVLGATALGVIIQEFVAGVEYGIDVMNDLDGHHVGTCVRRKLLMRAGETDKAIIVQDGSLEQLASRLSAVIGHVAVLDCDVIQSEDRTVVLDLNPRFGGGYPFSHVAGVDMPRAIVAWLRGESPPRAWFEARPGVAAAKYESLMLVTPD